MMENQKIIDNLILELNRGTQVLAVLLTTMSECYGYSLVQSLKETGIEIEQNTLYPLLRRLEKQGLLESSWDTSESRPRKYYTRTELGAEVAATLKREWRTINTKMEIMIDEEESK